MDDEDLNDYYLREWEEAQLDYEEYKLWSDDTDPTTLRTNALYGSYEPLVNAYRYMRKRMDSLHFRSTGIENLCWITHPAYSTGTECGYEEASLFTYEWPYRWDDEKNKPVNVENEPSNYVLRLADFRDGGRVRKALEWWYFGNGYATRDGDLVFYHIDEAISAALRLRVHQYEEILERIQFRMRT